MTCPFEWTPERIAQADLCDREKVRDFDPWQLIEDAPEQQQPKERNDRPAPD